MSHMPLEERVSIRPLPLYVLLSFVLGDAQGLMEYCESQM